MRENGERQTKVSEEDERRVIVERAIATAIHNRDTPPDCGFGYEFEGLEDGEQVSIIKPVPYCGDERRHTHIRQRIDPFMRDLPA